MHRMFLIVVLLGLVALGVGFLVLGAFPPEPHPQQIQKVLPNDRFQPKSASQWTATSRRSWKCWPPSAAPPATR